MGLFFAWAIGEGIIIWRWAKAKAPPPPGQLLLASGLFLGLAVIAEYQPARTAATAFAYAVDLAVLLQVVGKDPKAQTGWPPPFINNPAVILPGGQAAAGATAKTGTSAIPAVQGSAVSEAEQAGGFLPKALFGELP